MPMAAALTWALGKWRLIGLAFLLALLGLQTVRLADQRAETAAARKDLADYRATAAESGRLAERAARNTEQTWRSRVDGVIQDGREQVATARADAATAAAGQRRLRDQLAVYRAAVRAATAAPAAATGGAPAADPLDLLADLFGRADARAGELARIADERGAAGATCERWANATEP
uniref:DUF2514 family protein n=1 Tax=Variovorax sp. HH01 TaxID=1084736 RepID=I3PCM6_9BURK|nr:hypothetical protein var055 [Variovorax sp. HH01]